MALAPSLRVFRHRAYLHFWLMRVSIAAARQMEAITIGYQVYDMARRPAETGGLGWSIEEAAFLLGLVGLAQFVPVFLLSLIGGQAADRLNRKMILIVSNVVRLLLSFVLLASVFMAADRAIPLIFLVAVLLGCVNAFTPAAANSLFPRLVPRDELPNAIAWNSLGFQTAVITGPAIGGLIYGFFGAATVYWTAIGLASFAEGIDLPGSYVTHVVIVKIPFAVPDDPIQAAISEWMESSGRNPFMELTLPAASIRLIQACGRLIRQESDKGRVSILDKRLVSSRYGSLLLDSLPPFRRIAG